MTYGLRLEHLNSLDVSTDIISNRLEVLEDFLRLVNDALVLQDATVVGDVDCCGLR